MDLKPVHHHIYIDGSCLNNGLPDAVATWSYVVTDECNNTVQACSGLVDGMQNNNRAELSAYIACLEHVVAKRNVMFTIHTDFEALYLYCNGKANPKSNYDLYRQIDRLHKLCRDRIVVEKVKAHQNNGIVVNVFNNMVDRLAKRSMSIFTNKSKAV